MFEIAWSELFIILVVAIIVVGPKELPGMLRGLGRIIGKLRRSADDFRRQFDESMREAGGEDLHRELNELRRHNPLNEIRNTIEEAAREATQPKLPAPESYVDKPEEPPVPHETPAEQGAKPAPQPAIPATPAEAAPNPATPGPAPAKEPQATPAASPGHEPLINGQHRPLS
jgi:sec-independent protein translocase protein TatB